MNERYVGRVRPPRLSAPGRVVARVAASGKTASAAGTPAPRGVASVKPATVAEPVASATQMLQSPDVTAAIFVDGSGRRGRRLRVAAYALVLIALTLTLAFWVLQGVDALGSA